MNTSIEMDLSFSSDVDSPLDPELLRDISEDLGNESPLPPPLATLPTPPPNDDRPALCLGVDVPAVDQQHREDAAPAARHGQRRRVRPPPALQVANRRPRRDPPPPPPAAVTPNRRQVFARSTVIWCGTRHRVTYRHHCTGHARRPHNPCVVELAWLPHDCVGHLPYSVQQGEVGLDATRRRILDLLDLGYPVLASGSSRPLRALLRDRHYEDDIRNEDIVFRAMGMWPLAPGHEANLRRS